MSFAGLGLQEDNPSDAETECCDVRWDSRADNSSKGTLKRTHPSCQHGTSLTSSAASRLCNSRLKLCLLVLVLLHTVATLTASHNPTGFNLTSSSSNEEWRNSHSVTVPIPATWRTVGNLLVQKLWTCNQSKPSKLTKLNKHWTNPIKQQEQGTTP